MCGERGFPLKPFEPHLEKAERYIRSARILTESGDYDSAASRLYYAMFYTAEALLEALGLSFSSHRAIIAAYGQHFAKTKELDPKFHQILIAAFNKRQLGDYRVQSGLGKEDVETLLVQATEFVDEGRKWLEDSGAKKSVGGS
jgi:uncharacterized protein (UPF0332 family)